MVTKEFARKFAQEWIDAWNSHDLERVLAHYADDFVIETPMAALLKPESEGTVNGKPAVREYWQLGLSKLPDLHFEMLDLLIGVYGLTIYYVNTASKRRSVEMMFFNAEDKVNRVFVNYTN